MEQLPSFGISDYKKLLLNLIDDGRIIYPVTKIDNCSEQNAIFLRHDVDLFLDGWLNMPKCEYELGITATYYICLTQHYNIFQNDSIKFINQIIEMGHEIGLHYDVSTYPQNKKELINHLEFEVRILSKLVGKNIKTIVMHQPFQGNTDPFLDLNKYINPTNPKYKENLIYISDSCRAWRDEKLLEIFKNKTSRIMLNLHPELWLDGRITNRIEYLDKVLFNQSLRSQSEYYENTVRKIWTTHEATKLHDRRNQK